MNTKVCRNVLKRKTDERTLKDKIYTPDNIARDCIDKIKYKINSDTHLYEPFYGKGAFYNLFGDNPKSFTEIDLGLDFFEIDNNYEECYIITNPPYSIMTEIIDKFIEMSNLKGFGVLVNNLTMTPTRLSKLEDSGFYATDLYIFKLRAWFGYQNFWFFERLDIKPQVNISYRRKTY
tara:strand:+ start:9 stop:539 length:531 start_codon:yes stop_codon:yes gene_type:complete